MVVNVGGVVWNLFYGVFVSCFGNIVVEIVFVIEFGEFFGLDCSFGLGWFLGGLFCF